MERRLVVPWHAPRSRSQPQWHAAITMSANTILPTYWPGYCQRRVTLPAHHLQARRMATPCYWCGQRSRLDLAFGISRWISRWRFAFRVWRLGWSANAMPNRNLWKVPYPFWAFGPNWHSVGFRNVELF